MDHNKRQIAADWCEERGEMLGIAEYLRQPEPLREALDLIRNTMIAEFPELRECTVTVERKVRFISGAVHDGYDIWFHYEGLKHIGHDGVLWVEADTLEAALAKVLEQFPEPLRQAVEFQRELEAVRRTRNTTK